MEDAMDDLKLVDIKKESLHKCLDQLHAQASSILSFTLEWKDLEAHCESSKAFFLRKMEELALLEKKNVEMLKVVEEREEKFEIKAKKYEECISEVQNKEKQLGLVKNWIQECDLELKTRREELNMVRQEVEDCNVVLSVKKEELRLVQTQIESKERNLGSLEKLLEQHCREIFEKDEKLGTLQKSVEERLKELEFNEKEVERVRKLIANCDRDLEFKQKELRNVRNLINDCNKELSSKEMDLKMLQVRSSAKFVSKKDELYGIKKSIECSKELDLKKEELDRTKELIQECVKELDSEERELSLIKKSIGESSKDFDSRQNHLGSISVLIDEYTEELEAKEKQHDAVKKSINVRSAELKSKETELRSIEDSIKELSAKLHQKEEKLDSARQHVKHCARKIESKEEELNKIKGRMNTYDKELESREREFHAIQLSIEYRSEELKGKERQLKSVQLSIRECEKELKAMKEQKNSIQKLILECSEKLQSKEKNLILARQSLRECCDDLELKKVQLDSIQRSSHELNKKSEEKEKHLNSLEKTLDERLKIFGVKEMQFEERVNEIELKEQQLHLMQQSVEKYRKEVELKEQQLGSNILSTHVRVDQTENVINPKHASTSTFQFNATTSERSSPVVNVCVSEHDLMHHGVSAEPAKVVLDIVQNWKKGLAGFDASVNRDNVVLLEQLMKVSPKISPQVKEAATKLAVLWEKNIRLETEDSMEVLMFLLFLAVYGLVSCFRRDRILRLVRVIAQQKQAPEIFKALGFAGKDLAPAFIENLIEEKQYVAAARFSLAFELVSRYPPEVILRKGVDAMNGASASTGRTDSSEAQACIFYRILHGKHIDSGTLLQRKAIDKAISALRSILELVADYKYESKYVTEDIIRSISYLEKKREGWTRSLQAPNSVDQPQLQGRNYHTAGISCPADRLASASVVQPQLLNPNLWNQLQQEDMRFRSDFPVDIPGVRNQSAFAPIMQPHLHSSNFQDQEQLQDNNKRPRIDLLADRPQVTQDVAAYGGATQFFTATNHFGASDPVALFFPSWPPSNRFPSPLLTPGKRRQRGKFFLIKTLKESKYLYVSFAFFFLSTMEEKVSNELKNSELKQEIVRKTMNELQEKASSVLLLCLQWKELEDHFDSIRGLIQAEKEEVERKERVVREREREVGVKEKRVEELVNEVKLKDQDFKEWRRELELKEINFGQKVRERYDEIELKEKKVEEEFREVALREERADKRFKEAEEKERRVGELFKEVRVKDDEFWEWRKEVELKEKELELKGREVEERIKEIGLKDRKVEERIKEIGLKDRKVEESLKELGLKDRKVEERINEIGLKDRKVEERLKEIGFKDRKVGERLKEVGLKDRMVEERLKEVGLKGREVEERVKKIALMEKNVGKRSEEVELNRRKLEEGFRELESKSREVEEIIKGVELKEKELEERCRAFDLKGKQIEEVQLKEKELEERLQEVEMENKKCLERIKEFELKEKQVADACNARVKSETVDYSLDANLHFSVKMDGKALQILLNKRCKHDEKMKNEVSIALGLSSDPAKLVLDAMEGFHPPHLREGDVEFKEVVVKRSCNLLLEQLMKISPAIKPHVRKEATKLAFLWMIKMTVDGQQNSDVLGFFNLLAAYGLASAFDSDELISRLVIIARNKQTPEFLRVLELGDKIPGFIQNLILKKQPMEAIRFIYAFEMVNQFPPGPILRDYLSGSKIAARKIKRSSKSIEGVVESVKRRVADLMVVLKCVEDYKLETVFSPDTLKQQIKDVERQLSIRKTKLPNLRSNSCQPNLSEKKRLAPKSAASASVLSSKSVSATKPAVNSTMAACTATSTAPITATSLSPTVAFIASPVTVTSLAPTTSAIAIPVVPVIVTSSSTTAAAAVTPIAVTSPASTASITASTTRSTVVSPSSSRPSGSIPKTEPQYQGGNKRCQAQYQGSDKHPHPQEQHQSGNKRPRIAKSPEVPLREPSLQNTGFAQSVPVPHQRAEGPFINQNPSGGHYNCAGYRPPNPQMSSHYNYGHPYYHENTFGKPGYDSAAHFQRP
ncbi:uncharacterized protein [Populus alba]